MPELFDYLYLIFFKEKLPQCLIIVQQVGTRYFEGPTTCTMCTKLTGIFEEKENAGSKIICSFEQFKPSIAPPIKIGLAKVRRDYIAYRVSQ